MSDMRTVVLVGHCGPDRFMLKSAVSRVVPGASIKAANNTKALERFLRPDAVLLVNRVLDGHFGSRSGIELIERVSQGDDPPVSILISNDAQAQAQAAAVGAKPGFGKSQLYDHDTADVLQAAVQAD